MMAPCGDRRRPQDVGVRQDRDVGRQRRVVIDPGGGGIDDGDALELPAPHDALVEQASDLGELRAVVHPVGHRDVGDHGGDDRAAVATEQSLARRSDTSRPARCRLPPWGGTCAASPTRKTYMPALISRTAASSALASFCSTMRSTPPSASRMTRPYPVRVVDDRGHQRRPRLPDARCASRNDRGCRHRRAGSRPRARAHRRRSRRGARRPRPARHVRCRGPRPGR